jgi:mannose-binding lectin 2
VHDSLDHAIRTLQKQERTAEERLRQLEEDVMKSLEDRITAVEQATKGHVEATVANAGGGWVWPFVLLAVFCAGVGAVGYMKYQALKKSHLL